MKQSQFFSKTLRESPKDEISANAKLLERGGFICKNSAGIYSYLPLGWLVISKIADIVRKEMNLIGGQEMLMPALIEKKYMEATGRQDVEIAFEVKSKKEKSANFILGWTHEEVLTAIAAKYLNSYKDLPISLYQIQMKFRNEPRAKSGLLRTREFIMKDLYSFHASESDFNKYYDLVKQSYNKIFEQVGLKSIYTLAGGGVFTANYTHEFQVVSPVGEDIIFMCEKCGYAENKEISKLKENLKCPKCETGKISMNNSIEVGNIFSLGTKYSKTVNLQFTNSEGKKEYVIMGSYGIGLGRVMGAAVEIHNDNKGIVWPESIAPYKIHLIGLSNEKERAETIYKMLIDNRIEVLYDDRGDKTAGEKFADADLIGIPIRMVLGVKSLAKNSVEIKHRNSDEVKLVKISDIKNVESFI